MDGSISGSGLLDSLKIHGAVPSDDNTGPQIELYAGEHKISQYDTLEVGSRLEIRLFDQSGIAIKGKSEYIPPVSVSIDGGERITLSDSIMCEVGDFRKATVPFVVPDLPRGNHLINITAFDNLNNRSSIDLNVYVRQPGLTTFNIVYAYPNPASEFCYIICEFQADLDIEVTIYTLSGRKIRTLPGEGRQSYHEIFWDLCDESGDPVSNGTYLVRVEPNSRSEEGEDFKTNTIIVVAR